MATKPVSRKRTRSSDKAEEILISQNIQKDEENGDKPKDEYEKDSSDEEDARNTVGNIPMEWYKEFDHVGYDVAGKKIMKPKQGDEVDDFLQKMDNPDYWRTVKDRATGQNFVLSDDDIALIKNYAEKRYTESSLDPYEPSIDFFTHEVMIHPLSNHPDQKRSFIPSLYERKKVGEFVDAIKSGRMKMSEPQKEDSDSDDQERPPQFYQLWSNDTESEMSRRYRQFIPAPKIRLPGHAESYNPPPEYLFDEKEKKAWDEKEPSERRLPFVPRRYGSVREVPAYPRFVNERFERCLDLYLLPRQIKMRANVRAEDLLPRLPQPKDLQPFPTTQAMIYEGHTGPVLCISTEPSGHWLASGSADESLKIWEVSSGRCLMTVRLSGPAKDIAWNPTGSLPFIAVAVNDEVLIIKSNVGDNTFDDPPISNAAEDESTASALPVKWLTIDSGKDRESGIRLKITHPKNVDQVVWHKKGDFFAVVMKEGQGMSVLLHQLSKRKSQNPFKKPKGIVQAVLFHPSKPNFFVATQRYVRQYDLIKQVLMRKLMTGCKWVSSFDVHPGGDNIIIGSYDKRLSWFDLALSAKPYKTLRHHQKAIRKVCYHRSYPLFASASDDGTVIVCHGMVYNDLTMNPLIVPVKVLKGHVVTEGLGVLDCEFHPKEPWIFSAGADGTIRLFH